MVAWAAARRTWWSSTHRAATKPTATGAAQASSTATVPRPATTTTATSTRRTNGLPRFSIRAYGSIVPNPRVPDRATMVTATIGRKKASSRMPLTPSERSMPWRNTLVSRGASAQVAAPAATPASSTGQRAARTSGASSCRAPSARLEATARTIPVSAPSRTLFDRIVNSPITSKNAPAPRAPSPRVTTTVIRKVKTCPPPLASRLTSPLRASERASAPARAPLAAPAAWVVTGPAWGPACPIHRAGSRSAAAAAR